MRKIRVWLAFVALVLAGGCALPGWPLEGRMTSAYGLRMRGLLPEMHDGVDIVVPEGTPVRAMQNGRVRHAGGLGGYGLAVIVAHGGTVESLYAHLSQIDVAVGDEVSRGQVLGLSGQTGNATGPHLHFEIRRYGYPEDPVLLLGRPPAASR